jgi:hydrogenase maturation protease
VSRILVAGVGNVLRGDDGFGAAVVARLGDLPRGVEAIETGIGGVALLQELMAGCDGLVLIDAIERGAEPGTVFVEQPEIGLARHLPDMHLADPEHVLGMAKGMGALPERVVIVGCQAAETEELEERLSPAVERAVAPAAARVEQIVREWAGARV